MAISTWPASAQANVSPPRRSTPPSACQHCAGGQRRAEPAVEQRRGRDRQHHVQQREDLRQPADVVDADAVVVRGRRGDRRERQPQHLVGGADQRVGRNHRPASGRGAACRTRRRRFTGSTAPRPGRWAPRRRSGRRDQVSRLKRSHSSPALAWRIHTRSPIPSVFGDRSAQRRLGLARALLRIELQAGAATRAAAGGRRPPAPRPT